jgi:hypothetical protein
VYIAGKVTGLDEMKVRAEFMLRKLYLQEDGYEVFCPIEHCKQNWSWYRCMAVCIFNLIFRCNKISLLHNWKHSRGARIEYRIAKILNYKIV